MIVKDFLVATMRKPNPIKFQSFSLVRISEAIAIDVVPVGRHVYSQIIILILIMHCRASLKLYPSLGSTVF